MPRVGDEFNSFWIDDKSSASVARMTTYRYRENGRTHDPVRIVERRIAMAELLFSSDPWQPPRWVYHYGNETVWVTSSR